MAIRKSVDEEFVISEGVSILTEKCKNSLQKGGFTNIKYNSIINQIEADYKTFKVVGSITITLLAINESTTVKIKSTANMDNIFALIKSPNIIILSAFKDNLS